MKLPSSFGGLIFPEKQAIKFRRSVYAVFLGSAGMMNNLDLVCVGKEIQGEISYG